MRERIPTRALGSTGLTISTLGLGTAAIGSNPADDRLGIAAIHRAVDLGINWIDTAPVYGNRRAEALLGTALRRVAVRPLVFGKTSMSVVDGQISHSLDPKTLRRDLDASLLRLGLDELDVLFMHWPIPDERLEEGWGTLATLRDEGKVRFLGASNFRLDQVRRAMSVARIDVAQGRYSLIDTSAQSKVIAFCAENDIGYTAYGALGHGLFAGAITRERLATMKGDFRAGLPAFKEPNLTRSFQLSARVAEIAAAHGVEPGVVAISWVLRDPRVTAAIVGLRKPSWVEKLVPQAAAFALSPREADSIDPWAQRVPGRHENETTQ